MATALTDCGFELFHGVHKDLRLTELGTILRLLCDECNQGDEQLFYFSGHGLSVHGHAFLISVGMPSGLTELEDYNRSALAVDSLDGYFRNSENAKIFIIDACRSSADADPVVTGSLKGPGLKLTLADINSSRLGQTTCTIYSSSEGTPSYDGTAKGHSLMTGHLLPLLKMPAIDIKNLTIELTESVLEDLRQKKVGKMLVRRWARCSWRWNRKAGVSVSTISSNELSKRSRSQPLT